MVGEERKAGHGEGTKAGWRWTASEVTYEGSFWACLYTTKRLRLWQGEAWCITRTGYRDKKIALVCVCRRSSAHVCDCA